MKQASLPDNDYQSMVLNLDCLYVYRALLDEPVLRAARSLIKALAEELSPASTLKRLSRLLSLWLRHSQGLSWQDYLIAQILLSDNIFSRQMAMRARPLSEKALLEAAALDLKQLQALAALDGRALKNTLREKAISGGERAVLQKLPDLLTWPQVGEPSAVHKFCAGQSETLELWALFSEQVTEAGAWARLARNLAEFHARRGYGPFVFNQIFQCDTDSRPPTLRAVAAHRLMPDAALYDYTHSFARLRENTERFVEGQAAANALLYGPRGTGKSSSIRAMPGQFAGALRLIELKREQLFALPALFEIVEHFRLRFILFIDDLSFDRLTDEYVLLKNILEGSVVRQPDNVLLYVSSNRRHLVSENFSDTENALYANDIRSERLSLAERFGLRLRFTTPNKSEYLALIHYRLEAQGLVLTESSRAELEAAALRHAAAEASMTPRVAEQFLRQFLLEHPQAGKGKMP